MANTDAAFGLRPVSKLDGSSWSGATREAYWAGDTSTTLYPGDPVVLSGTGDDNGVPAVTKASTAGPVWGVMVNVSGDSSEDLLRDSNRYLSTSAGYLQVVKAEDMLFEIQEDSDSTDLAKTDIGLYADFIYGTPSTSHPIRSAVEIDSSSADTSSASAVQIINLPRRPDNTIGSNANWLVRINNLNTGAV